MPSKTNFYIYSFLLLDVRIDDPNTVALGEKNSSMLRSKMIQLKQPNRLLLTNVLLIAL